MIETILLFFFFLANLACSTDLYPMMWKEDNNQLVRVFEFKNFVEAFGFMTQVAIIAEKMNHHPNWSNVYNTVEVKLCTHDAGNIITDNDRELAAAIDKLV